MTRPSSASSGKRKETDAPVSPPPVKRKVQSGTTKNAVASFFTPTSQKPKDRTIWSERSPNDDTPSTLLVGRYEPETKDDTHPMKRRKVAAFDLDSTLIATSSGKKHANEASDWKWWHSSVPGKLKDLYNDQGYRVVVLSNQAGLTLHPDPNSKGPKPSGKNRVAAFKQKCNAVLSQLDIPITLYAATGKDIYRKPRTGMWKELCEDYDLKDDVDLENSVFVGDAGGRIASHKTSESGVVAAGKDFSCSDRNLAHNIGIDYQTPEEFFLGEKPRDFAREFDLAKHPYSEVEGLSASKGVFEKKNGKDIVIFCGPPGAGKSTFYWNYLKPLDYERVNQDILKTRDKCIQAAKDFLQNGQSVVVDNTNADPDTRAIWVELAKKSNVPVRCIWFKTPIYVCEHNDAVRAQNTTMNPEARTGLPKVAFTGFASRHKEPKVKEGFQDVTEVEFKFRGTKEEHEIWARYWL